MRPEPEPWGGGGGLPAVRAASLLAAPAQTSSGGFAGLWVCGVGRAVGIPSVKWDPYFCPEQVPQRIPPLSGLLRADSVCWETRSSVQQAGEQDHLSGPDSGWRRPGSRRRRSHPEPADFLDFRFTN